MWTEEIKKEVETKMIDLLKNDGKQLISFLMVWEEYPDSKLWRPLEKTLLNNEAFSSVAIQISKKCSQVLFLGVR